MTLNPLDDLQPLNSDDLPDEALAAIVALLHEHRHFDLHNYKESCIRRRILKRLRASGASDVADYLARLARDDHELDLLLETLTIHVSRFFRDMEVFQLLEKRILPDLCARLRAAGRTRLRLWSAGCAGGEEAYSLALLIDSLTPSGLPATILGTDISEPVLAQAREGLYHRDHLTEMPASLRARFFQAEGTGYRLQRRIREMVDFQCQDLIATDTYPQVDLILCRNVLIYFSHEEQLRILSAFAAVLGEDGVLVAGRTENLLHTEPPLFDEVFPGKRIFRRRPESLP